MDWIYFFLKNSVLRNFVIKGGEILDLMKIILIIYDNLRIKKKWKVIVVLIWIVSGNFCNVKMGWGLSNSPREPDLAQVGASTIADNLD